MSPTLHHAAGTRSIRVLWTLEEIGAAYDVATTLFPPRTRAPEYLEVNPTGTIPAFVDEDIRLTESMAICQVLAERHGRADLQVDPGQADRADYLQWLWYGEATLAIPLGIMARVRRLPSPEGTELLITDVREALNLRLAVLDVRLGGREFIVADRFTLADVACAYPLFLLDRFGTPEVAGPNARAYWSRLKERPALQRALAVP